MSYTPPPNTQIPFIFTQGGYVAPTGEMLFEFAARTSSFSNLNAAIQVTQLYHEEAHTYVKSCPKYIIGYADGKVQIIKGPCIWGGIRDLWCSVTVIGRITEDRDLHGIISAHTPKDLQEFIRIKQFGSVDLSKSISVHLPEDIRYAIRSWRKGTIDLPSSIYGWQQLDLHASILMHPPKDLEVSLFAKKRDYRDLNTFIYAWHIKDLQVILGRVIPCDLPIVLNMIHPVNLSAYLKVRYVVDLKGSLRGWAIKDLSAVIKSNFAENLNVKIYGRDDMFKNLYARIKGQAIEVQSLLGASIRAFIDKDLNISLTATYLSDLYGYLFPVRPKDISANIYGWAVSDLQIILNGCRGPWDLLASIFPNEDLRFLGVTIYPKQGTEILGNLPINIHSWDTRYLTSSISLTPAGNLRAILIPYLQASDLHVSIYPKMIRLSTLVKVATMEHRDLSAMINSFCVYTGYKNLSASMYITYKSDLPAYIKTLKYSYKPRLLGATIGYTDTITEVDKYQISVNILPSEMRTFDRYLINFNIMGSVKFLSAYIKGVLRSSSLGATITAQEMDPYSFEQVKTTEQVVHLTYAGMFETYETVETSFKSLVKDYYYSSDGDFAWKSDRLDRWILEIKSFLPINVSLRLKRRLHKETCLYDLERFSSIDEAMRHAISYVTEYPQSDLGNSIYGSGGYIPLGMTISPRYVKEGGQTLGGVLTPIVPTIIIGTESGNITKI